MNHYLLIPAVSTLSGIFVSYLLRKAVIKRFPGIVRSLSRNIPAGIFSIKDSGLITSGSEGFQNIQPAIEVHIDEFLRHKLGREMPMIGMFIGDKTIAQLKSVFMKELEEIFPLVMDKYVSDLSSRMDPGAVITQKLSSLSPEKINTLIDSSGITARKVFLYGAVAGFVTGLLQLFVLWLVSQI